MRFVVCSILMAASAAGFSEIVLSKDSDQFVNRSHQTLHRLGRDSSSLVVKSRRSGASLLPGERVKISIGADYDFEYDVISNQLREFIDYKIGIETERKVVPKSESEPTWLPDNATEIAELFLRNEGVLGKFHFGEPKTRWIVSYRRENFVLQPFWMITFPRLNALGVPFVDDYVSVRISEEFGVYAYKGELFTETDEESNALPDPSEAIKFVPAAALEAERTIENPVFSGILPAGNLVTSIEPVSSVISIVRPNYFNKKQNFDFSLSTRDGSLAWVFLFNVWKSIQERELDHENKNVACSVWVWIDATTGSYLGGDLVSH